MTGSNRGLGLEFVRALVSRDFVVYATCRLPDEAGELKELSSQYPDKVRRIIVITLY